MEKDIKKPLLDLWVRRGLWTILAVYTVLMAILLFYRPYMDGSDRSLQLIPFENIRWYLTAEGLAFSVVVTNVAGNIGCFVPLGLLVAVLRSDKTPGYTVGIVALCSLSVETIQYVTASGIADIDDLILNTLGGLIGALLYVLVRHFAKTKERTERASLILLCVLGLAALPLLINWFN